MDERAIRRRISEPLRPRVMRPSVRKGRGEVLTGGRAGRVLSREILPLPGDRRELRGADTVQTGGRPHSTHRHREMRRDLARSKAPSTHGSASHTLIEPGVNGNREVPRSSAVEGAVDRIGKSKDTRRW